MPPSVLTFTTASFLTNRLVSWIISTRGYSLHVYPKQADCRWHGNYVMDSSLHMQLS